MGKTSAQLISESPGVSTEPDTERGGARFMLELASWFKPQLSHEQPWLSYLSSLCFSFLICGMRTQQHQLHTVIVQI